MQRELADRLSAIEQRLAELVALRHADIDSTTENYVSLTARVAKLEEWQKFYQGEHLPESALRDAGGKVKEVAGECAECGGPVFHRDGPPGEYDHECFEAVDRPGARPGLQAEVQGPERNSVATGAPGQSGATATNRSAGGTGITQANSPADAQEPGAAPSPEEERVRFAGCKMGCLHRPSDACECPCHQAKPAPQAERCRVVPPNDNGRCWLPVGHDGEHDNGNETWSTSAPVVASEEDDDSMRFASMLMDDWIADHTTRELAYSIRAHDAKVRAEALAKMLVLADSWDAQWQDRQKSDDLVWARKFETDITVLKRCAFELRALTGAGRG